MSKILLLKPISVAIIMAVFAAALLLIGLFDPPVEYAIQILTLMSGLITYQKISTGTVKNKSVEHIIIIIIYSVLMGRFYQELYPTSEPRSIVQTLYFHLKHDGLLILTGAHLCSFGT